MVHHLYCHDVTGVVLGTERKALGANFDFAFWLYTAKKSEGEFESS
jgi:hypothetical protein